MTTVYLCGPITGQTYEQASGWRAYVTETLRRRFSMEVFDPMNIEGYPEGELSAPGGDYPGLGPSMTSKSIFKRDRWYVYNSDIILANFSMITPIVSIGSVMEIAWADAWGKAIVTIMNDQHQHGFIAEASTTLCRDLEDAIQAIGVLNRR